MSRLIDADALVEATINNPIHAPYITSVDIQNAPTVDAVPVDKIAHMLAEYFENPCNFTPLDEIMCEVCGEECDMDDVKCWERWIKLKMDEEMRETDD